MKLFVYNLRTYIIKSLNKYVFKFCLVGPRKTLKNHEKRLKRIGEANNGITFDI